MVGMAVEVECGACHNRVRVADKLAGKVVSCPHCQGRITVPAPPAADVDELELALEPSEPSAAPSPSVLNHLDASPRRDRVIGANVDRSRKDFLVILRQSFTAPTEAFDALGVYLLNSPVNLAAAAGFFCLGVLIRASAEASLEGSGADAMTFTGALLSNCLALPLTAVMIDLASYMLTGVSRFLAWLATMVYLDALIGFLHLLVFAGSAIDPGTGLMMGYAVWFVGIIYGYIALTAAYEIDLMTAIIIMVAARWLALFLITSLILGAAQFGG
jgi:hypothetical protein